MSSEFHPTYIHLGPSNGRPGRGYLLRVTSPDAGEFGSYEYYRIWITIPKDMPELIPNDSNFKRYRKADWDTDMEPGALSASLMTSHDVYEVTTDEPPTLERDGTAYHPYGRGSDRAYCIIDSTVVCYNGVGPSDVVEILKAYAKKKGVTSATAELKQLRPYVLQTSNTRSKKAYVIRDTAPGSEERSIAAFIPDGLDSYDFVNDAGPFTIRSKQLSKTEGMHVGEVPDPAYNKTAYIVLGVLSTREDGEWRRVDYGTAEDSLHTDDERRAMSNEVEPLEQPAPPSVETPGAPPVVPTPGEASVEDVAIPPSEKRTRAQLYAALVAAEKFGDRTIKASRFEGNARQIGTDTYSHETVVREAPNMTQGELVSLVTVLVNRIMADDVIIDEYNKAKSEGRLLSVPKPAPSVRIETNIIVGGVGYDLK